MSGNTHYAVLVYSGDPDGEQDGHGPEMTLIACGPEQFCWDSLSRWTDSHEMRRWEHGEVLARDPSTVRIPPVAATPKEDQ